MNYHGWYPFELAIRGGVPLAAEIAGDWLRDRGADEIRAAESIEPPTWNCLLPANYYGIGIGIGIGSGRGRGIGSGIGIGIGIGGSGSGRKIAEVQMEPGRQYLILTVDWYAWCGRCIRQVAPYEYEFEHVSKFDTNQGDVFGEVAANKPGYRSLCTFHHFEGKAILGLGRVGVFEWKGKLPQETTP